MRRFFVLVVVVVLITTAGLFFAFQRASNSDGGPVGAKARDLVKGPFSHIVFEIDYFAVQPQIVPDKQEVARFLRFVETYTGKTTEAVYQELPVELATTGHWDAAELRVLDTQTRNTHSLPLLTLSVHIIYANALFEPPKNDVAGISITSTTIVLFKGIIPIGAEDVVLAHEFGHLLGLCGLVTPSDLCDGAGHAKNPMSLMAAAIDTRNANVRDLVLYPEEVALLATL